MKNLKRCDFRDLRLRHVGVLAAMVCLVGHPLSAVEMYLFGPSERMLSLLSSRSALGPDTLTALAMAVFCLILGLFLLAGDRFLRRFLN